MALREPPSRAIPLLPAGTFAGRSAVITGGGSGLGLATAFALAQLGANVALVGRSLEKLQSAADHLADDTGSRIIAVVADVRKAEDVAAAFEMAESELGPISLLGNNAGANFPVLSGELSPNGFAAVSRIALDGTFLASREFYRRYLAHGLAEGAIVNNGAQYQFQGFPGGAASCAAKAAVASLTQTLAVEWAPDGIRVNSVVAGFFPHAATYTATTAGDPEDTIGSRIAAGRPGRLHELGWFASFLFSSYAGFITGQNIFIDGAESLRRTPGGAPFTPVQLRESVW